MNIIYLIGNNCFYNNGKKNYSFIMSNGSLKNGKVADKNLFFKDIQYYFKKSKLIGILFSKPLKCIVNSLYNQVDIDILKDILEQLNFKNIIIVKEIELLDFKKTDYLCLCNEYYILYYKNKYKQKKFKLIPRNYFPSYKELTSFINVILGNSKRNLFLYGVNISEDVFQKIYKNIKNPVFLLCNSEQYIINISSN